MIATKRILFTLGPVSPQDFVGRELETVEVLQRAREDVPPLQSLEGPSKIGRTSMLFHLRAITRGEVEIQLSGVSPTRMIAPYVDLAMRPSDGPSAEEAILDAITDEISQRGLEPPAVTQGPRAMTAMAETMKALIGRRHSFLLLVDHVEHLLARSGENERGAWAASATSALGELNERVRIAVVLGFGATGPARNLPAGARRLRIIEALGALSDILNRGNATRTTLGQLDDADVRAFAGRARGPSSGGRERPLDADEVEWIVRLAGGHPLVMQNAGVRLAEAAPRGDPGMHRAELERELAAGLQGFMIDAFRRIEPFDKQSSAMLDRLAKGEAVELEPRLATGLEEEGLVRAVDRSSGEVTTPSLGLQMALRDYLEARDEAESVPSAGSDARALPRVPSSSLALRDEADGTTLHLTRSEHALMKVLIAAGGSSVTSREALKVALGPDTKDPQLTQRISVLRKKIGRTFGVIDPIESLYGEGYRLKEPKQYLLRGNPQ